VGFYLL